MPKRLDEALGKQRLESGRVGERGLAVADRHANPAGAGQLGEWIAITLNNSPISSLPVRRWTAAASSSARSGWLPASAAARWPMPRRLSHSPWETGPVTSAPANRAALGIASKST